MVSEVTIGASESGIFVEHDAHAILDGNRIEGSSGAGIRVEPGASGRATSNELTCSSGDCLCFGADCDDDDDDIESKGFKFSGNKCHREQRGWLSKL
jgi:hypothetical protein